MITDGVGINNQITVGELIAELSKHPHDMPVWVDDPEYGPAPLRWVVNRTVVWWPYPHDCKHRQRVVELQHDTEPYTKDDE